jgi:hypothetical protein
MHPSKASRIFRNTGACGTALLDWRHRRRAPIFDSRERGLCGGPEILRPFDHVDSHARGADHRLLLCPDPIRGGPHASAGNVVRHKPCHCWNLLYRCRRPYEHHSFQRPPTVRFRWRQLISRPLERLSCRTPKSDASLLCLRKFQ